MLLARADAELESLQRVTVNVAECLRTARAKGRAAAALGKRAESFGKRTDGEDMIVQKATTCFHRFFLHSDRQSP